MSPQAGRRGFESLRPLSFVFPMSYINNADGTPSQVGSAEVNRPDAHPSSVLHTRVS